MTSDDNKIVLTTQDGVCKGTYPAQLVETTERLEEKATCQKRGCKCPDSTWTYIDKDKLCTKNVKKTNYQCSTGTLNGTECNVQFDQSCDQVLASIQK